MASQRDKEREKDIEKIINQSKTSIFEVKPRKQVKNIIYLEVSYFTTTKQLISYDQIKMVLDLQVEVKKLKQDKKNLMVSLKQQMKQNLDYWSKKKPLKPSEIFHKAKLSRYKIALEAERTRQQDRKKQKKQKKTAKIAALNGTKRMRK